MPLAPIEVSTTRSDARAPLARTTLSREQVREVNWGQDTPMALGSLPGAYAYSDAGNGIGYSYLSLRGFPQRRISVLVNGVPLNDPESHEVWWIDHPDLLASTAELQVCSAASALRSTARRRWAAASRSRPRPSARSRAARPASRTAPGARSG